MHAIHGRVLPNFSISFLPKLFMALCHEQHAQSKCMPFMAECCPIFLFPSFPNSSWYSAMNGMRNLNACRPWQSAAQFFSFLFFSNFTWHSAMNSMCNLNACRSWQSAAQFFSFLFFLISLGTLP